MPLPPRAAIADDRSDGRALRIVFSLPDDVDAAAYFDRELPGAGWRLLNVAWDRGSLHYEYETAGLTCRLTIPGGGGRGQFTVAVERP